MSNELIAFPEMPELPSATSMVGPTTLRLGWIQVVSGQSRLAQDYPPYTFVVTPSGTPGLGSEFVAVVGTPRPKAIWRNPGQATDTPEVSEEIVNLAKQGDCFDDKSPLYTQAFIRQEQLKGVPFNQSNGEFVKVGPEILLYIPATETWATLHCGSRVLREEFGLGLLEQRGKLVKISCARETFNSNGAQIAFAKCSFEELKGVETKNLTLPNQEETEAALRMFCAPMITS